MSHEKTPRVRLIEASVHDLVSNLLYYDRKDDSELPRGEIEAVLAAKEVTVERLIEIFSCELKARLNQGG